MGILKFKNSDKYYNLITVLNMLGIDNKKVHLKEEQFISIYKLYKGELKGGEKSLNYNLKGMQNITKKYKSIQMWENANLKDKVCIHRGKYSGLLYYQIMVLLGRVSLDIDVLKEYNLPDLLSEEEKKLIIETSNKIGFLKGHERIIQSFNKLRFYTLKDLKFITEKDFCRFNTDVSNITSTKVFNILKSWGNISESSMYNDFIKTNREYIIDDIETCHDNLKQLYFEFKNHIKNLENNDTAFKKISICKRFIEWLNINYNNIDDLAKINYIHISTFVENIKKVKLKNNREYSESTINSEISRFKNGILKYLFINNMLSEELSLKIFSDDAEYNELYYKRVKGLPKPISMQDRKSIESALFKEYPDIDKNMLDIIRLCYFLGARPSEVICLKINCIKGIEQVPSIHIHRTKGFKERYVPLIEEAYKIVDYWIKINKDSIPIYLDYDKETSRRVFQVLGKVYSLAAIERTFNDLMRRNNIVDSANQSKYSLYILRKIRITNWLENGLSEEEVAYLVGHDNVDSHNAYIVSKELRKKNAKKVYNKLYKDILENNIDKNKEYISVKEEEKDKELEEFINILEEIESKNLNIVMKESIIKEFNEFVMPLPCGSCFAKVYDESFECAMMELPCLECDKFKKDDMDLDILNDYVKRLVISRDNKKKKGYDGLVMRFENQIEKVKRFYVHKLDKNIEEVEELFVNIEKNLKIKRGRPKKGRD